nr:unnamed protein product [Callosobruchus analis]
MVKFRSSTVAFGILYKRPKSNLPLAVEALDTFLSHLSVVYDHIPVLSDVNPTRTSSCTETLLDSIFTTFPERCTNGGALNTDVFTDHHRLVYCETHFEERRVVHKIQS